MRKQIIDNINLKDGYEIICLSEKVNEYGIKVPNQNDVEWLKEVCIFHFDIEIECLIMNGNYVVY